MEHISRLVSVVCHNKSMRWGNRGLRRAGNVRERLVIDYLEVFVTRRPANKNLYLRVKPPHGRIEVSAPVHASAADIEKLIRSHRDWIRRQQDGIIAAEMAQGGSRREAAGLLPADRSVPRSFCVSQWDGAHKKEAAGILRPKVDALLARYAKVTGRAPSHITLRTMTSRWGSCTPATRRIRLNLALAYMPEELLEYVLVHEMVHLYEKGHGKGFRDRMDMYLPGWRSRRHAINQYTIY